MKVNLDRSQAMQENICSICMNKDNQNQDILY